MKSSEIKSEVRVIPKWSSGKHLCRFEKMKSSEIKSEVRVIPKWSGDKYLCQLQRI